MPASRPLVSRMLEARGIQHRVHPFDRGIRSAPEVAAALGVDPSRVLKTLVVETAPPSARPFLLMAPAADTVDLKALARLLGLKALRMASHAEAERVTGLKVGGISALRLIGKGFGVLLAESALLQNTVFVSAGERGFEVELSPDDLARVTGARFVDLRAGSA
ncbi:MAG: Cys-tRNA(Pro)/Cys-tRNA(Cys) deacylase [Tepidiforma sp.]|nr:MAG: Cys-tRNA(Pro)/Cys-tRNA(Cys) deacylase [Tepidiforma sp.]